MPAAPPRPELFILRTAPEALQDLRARLHATRWPDAPEDAGWSPGTDLAYLRRLVGYWADGFEPRHDDPPSGRDLRRASDRPQQPWLRLQKCRSSGVRCGST
jgi:hypothetical protein